FYNRYVQQLWRISHRNVHHKPLVTFAEGTANVIEGFRRRGYFTAGVAAMDWFERPSVLQQGFDWFRVTGIKARQQTELLVEQIEKGAKGRAWFGFVNFGETHSPFHHEGLSEQPDKTDVMSLPRLFNQRGVLDPNRLRDERLFARQVACAEYLDA